MIHFDTQSIVQDSDWGNTIRTQRERLRWPLEEASCELGISVAYLKALESMDVGNLPGKVYARNFLRTYATWLDCDVDAVLSAFDDTWRRHASTISGIHALAARTRISQFLVWPRIVKRFVFSLGALAVFVYLGLHVYTIVSPPHLYVYYPLSDIQLTSRSVQVIGVTEPESILTINGHNVEPDPEGRFEKPISLEKGVNVLNISARRKFSWTAGEERRVIVLEDPESEDPESSEVFAAGARARDDAG